MWKITCSTGITPKEQLIQLLCGIPYQKVRTAGPGDESSNPIHPKDEQILFNHQFSADTNNRTTRY